MIRVLLPQHLQILAGCSREIAVDVTAPATQRSLLNALEAKYPALRGAIRDHGSNARRPMVRFFACREDLSHDSPDKPLPEVVQAGTEPFIIIGAIAGGADRIF